jgi:cytochrome c
MRRRVEAGLLLAACVLVGCPREDEKQAAAKLTGGDPAAGKVVIQKHGCGACHAIPGVPGANGTVGPALSGLAQRTYLAGRLPNSPDNLMRWVRHPQEVEQGNAMPELGVSEEDARHIAAYLYTLR